MISLYQFTTPARPCNYLPDRAARIDYDTVAALTAAEFADLLRAGWRRFGRSLFRPACPACSACQSLRVPVTAFAPDRSQRRALKANSDINLVVGRPGVSAERLELYDRFHAYQAEAVGWPDHPAKDPDDYLESFVENPYPTEEWRYYLGDTLVGVGYVDVVPVGLSAIYFYYDPDERGRSLGTFNVLRVIEAAAARRLPHVYLGYYVAGCRSLEYKARFGPNEVLRPDGTWVPFKS